MTDQLAVDTARLKAAGIALESLVFPAPPPPVAVAGADVISAAVNATLPEIEAPVINGLPAVKAALTRTGTNIAAAAGIYVQADQALGARLSQQQFRGADDVPAARAAAAQVGQFGQLVSPSLALATQVGDIAGTTGIPLTQGVAASVQGAVQGGAGPMPSQPPVAARDNDEEDTRDTDEERDEQCAAPGGPGRGSVPALGVAAAAAGQSGTLLPVED